MLYNTIDFGSDIMYDVIVIGGGHAGCEASLASARLGKKTLLITGKIKNIADMPCNPSIGGPAKGIIVREIDALGGEMGKNIDKSFLQMKMLNTKKGPAVRALRAQADKVTYQKEMQETILNEKNLEAKEAMAEDLVVENNIFKAVILADGTKITDTAKTGQDFLEYAEGIGLVENEDYTLTRQMSRFDDYTPSEAYWDGYRAGRWSSPWYNTWYSWYDPWYYDSWWYWNDPFYYSSWYGWRYPWYYSTWYSPRYYRPLYVGGGYISGGGGNRSSNVRYYDRRNYNSDGSRRDGTGSRPGNVRVVRPNSTVSTSTVTPNTSRSSGSFGSSSSGGVSRSSGSFGGGARSSGGGGGTVRSGGVRRR